MDQTLFRKLPKELKRKIHLIQARDAVNTNRPREMICGHTSKSQCIAHWERNTSRINGNYHSLQSYWDGLKLSRHPLEKLNKLQYCVM